MLNAIKFEKYAILADSVTFVYSFHQEFILSISSSDASSLLVLNYLMLLSTWFNFLNMQVFFIFCFYKIHMIFQEYASFKASMDRNGTM